MTFQQPLYEPTQAHRVIESAWKHIKASLMAGTKLELVVREPQRTSDQNKRMHAMLTDIARQVPIHGKTLDAESMKRVLVSAFKHDTKGDPDLAREWAQVSEVTIVPGLRGEFVVLGDQTRRFPKKLASAFVDWLFAFGAEHEVKWSDPALPKDSQSPPASSCKP